MQHENIDSYRTGIVLEVSCFFFASGAAYIREFMSHRLQNRIHHNESSIYRLRSTSTSEWFQLSRPAINKKASQTRCLTLPLCVAEVYTLRCDAMLAGTSHCPIHRPSTTNCLCCIRYAVFLYLQNLYLSTSKRCIKMGIPSLNIVIKIKFDFPFLCHHFDDIVQI